MAEYITRETFSWIESDRGIVGAREGLEKIGELIRCKDCKHRPIKIYDGIVPPKEDDWKCPCLCDDYFYSWIPEDNFFCANGERKNDEC